MKRVSLRAAVLLAVVSCVATATSAAAADTLERIRQSGRLTLGYRGDAPPFAARSESGAPIGYSIALCRTIADAVKSELRLPALAVEWVPVTAENRFGAVASGTIDVLCGADTVTIGRRHDVAFSIPIFPGGIAALLRADAPARLREALRGRGQTLNPTWRANATQALRSRAFAVVAGTRSEQWLTQRIDDLEVLTKILPVSSYETGVDAVVGRRADALFGERAIVLDLARRHANSRDLIVLDRMFTSEPLALTLPPNDDRFRLLVDRTLSHLYGSAEFGGLYRTWFAEPDEGTMNFFRLNTLPD